MHHVVTPSPPKGNNSPVMNQGIICTSLELCDVISNIINHVNVTLEFVEMFLSL